MELAMLRLFSPNIDAAGVYQHRPGWMHGLSFLLNVVEGSASNILHLMWLWSTDVEHRYAYTAEEASH
jgi:hypothetical protein